MKDYIEMLKFLQTVKSIDNIPDSYSFMDPIGNFLMMKKSGLLFDESGKNDVVLTPFFVADFMARLAKIKQGDKVCDFCAGTGGLLLAASRYSDNVHGCELNPTLAGYAARFVDVQHGDALEFNVGEFDKLIMNPPYSAPGKGLQLVEKAMQKLTGRAVILIQENAGAGQGLPYSAEIMKRFQLTASIHMADIFKGVAGVQTAVYVFDLKSGKKEDTLFIDMSNDGVRRVNKKNAAADKKLVDADHADDRYTEVVDVVLGRSRKTNYYNIFRDAVGETGDDWTVQAHKTINTRPSFWDFRKTVNEYMDWKIKSTERAVEALRKERAWARVNARVPITTDEEFQKNILPDEWFGKIEMTTAEAEDFLRQHGQKGDSLRQMIVNSGPSPLDRYIIGILLSNVRLTDLPVNQAKNTPKKTRNTEKRRVKTAQQLSFDW